MATFTVVATDNILTLDPKLWLMLWNVRLGFAQETTGRTAQEIAEWFPEKRMPGDLSEILFRRSCNLGKAHEEITRLWYQLSNENIL